ncbi:zf-C2H2 Zinc finger, C2H2 type [Emmonsiellopsis sp. PD_33]|nr:zf-C2H2 Zinc finger, C2H2 type [Emmonsiellopsis sp. PD_33]
MSTPTDKKYICTEAGCGKAFFRSEHLGRHRLNHRPKQVFQCPLCPKEFVRKDLLHRHEKRHEKGMWYRKSGGIVNAVAETSPPIIASSGSGSTQDAEHEDAHINDDASDSYPSHGGFHDQTSTQNQLDAAGDMQMGYSCNPLFFDSAIDIIPTPQLANQIDWFFEDSPIDMSPVPSSSGEFSTIPPNFASTGVFGAPPPASYAHHPDAAAAQLSMITPSPIPISIAPPWSTVKDRLQDALRSLPPDVLHSSFFYPTNLAAFFDLYFTHYHPHFPIFHIPTLSPAEAPPLLIAAIVTLGSTLTPDENHYRIATRIHDALRWLVFATGTFEPPAPLWSLQTLLIIQAREKMFSTRKHHEMAHIFHGAIITLMKRGTAYTTPQTPPEQPRTELEQRWRRWVTNEASKRTAFFAFIMDAQHAFMFGHSCTLAPHEVQLPLPCSDLLWEQSTALNWERARQETPDSPRFLLTLKGLLNNTPVPANCSPFSRLILLHGLFSVTAHLHARVLATLGVGQIASTTTAAAASASAQANTDPSLPTEAWKATIERAIDTWAYSLLSYTPSLALEACKPLHHMSHVAIHTNIVDFHILAGAKPLLDSRPPSRHDVSQAMDRVRAWSRNRECKKVLYHCLVLIQETVFTGRRYLARQDNIALRPWCLYHATLVLWGYGRMCAEAVQGQVQVPQGYGATPYGHPYQNSTTSQGNGSGPGGAKKRSIPIRASGGLKLENNDGGVAAPGGLGGMGGVDITTLSAEDYLIRMRMVLQSPTVPEMLEGANETRGLLLSVRECLEGCRWELLQEAYATLGKLAGL